MLDILVPELIEEGAEVPWKVPPGVTLHLTSKTV